MAQARRKGQQHSAKTPPKPPDAGEHHPEGALVPVTARGEATRRRILDAAEAVFGAKGYHAASVTEITQRAQVAQGTFYLYFHSKREIFLQLVEDLGEQLRDAMRAASRGATNRMEMERTGFAGFFAFARAHQQLFLIVQEADRVDLPTFRAYYERIARGYARGLRGAMDDGEIRQMDAEALAYALIGIGHFLALRWLIWPQEEETAEPPELPERVFSALLEFLAHGLKPF